MRGKIAVERDRESKRYREKERERQIEMGRESVCGGIRERAGEREIKKRGGRGRLQIGKCTSLLQTRRYFDCAITCTIMSQELCIVHFVFCFIQYSS